MLEPDDELICFCFGVRRSRLIAAIRAGAHTVEALRQQTGACGGCHGCWPDLEALIAEIRAEEAQDDPC